MRTLLREHLQSGMRAAWKTRIESDPVAQATIRYCILSPLAEGADRLVAEEVLETEDSWLEAVLPLPVEEYAEDFRTESSKRQFHSLLDRAKRRHDLYASKGNQDRPLSRNTGFRTLAYRTAGRFIVANCDLLIALWDEDRPWKRGGTTDTVAYARGKKPVLVFSLKEPGRIHLLEETFRLDLGGSGSPVYPFPE